MIAVYLHGLITESKVNQMPLRFRGLVYCSFCGRSQLKVRVIVAAKDVNICDDCVVLLTAGLPEAAPLAQVQIENCSFCDKRSQDVELVLGGEQARICNECLGICREIIADYLQTIKE